MNVGFIGLGVMGRPMARHLGAGGHRIALYDLDPEAAKRAAADIPDALITKSPREVAENAEIVFTMLHNGEIVQETATGPNGLIEGFAPGSMLVDTSSAEPWLTQQTASILAEKDIGMMEAPVSGAQEGAEAGTLVFMAGGTCEAMLIGKAHGLNCQAMLDVLNVSTGMSFVTQKRFEQFILSRTFTDAFKLELMLKDMGIANQLARDKDVPVPMSALAQQFWTAADAEFGPNRSVTEIVRWYENLTGHELTDGK